MAWYCTRTRLRMATARCCAHCAGRRNVNGLRAVLRRGSVLADLVAQQQPDVLFLAETKVDAAWTRSVGCRAAVAATACSLATARHRSLLLATARHRQEGASLLPGYTARWSCCETAKGATCSPRFRIRTCASRACSALTHGRLARARARQATQARLPCFATHRCRCWSVCLGRTRRRGGCWRWSTAPAGWCTPTCPTRGRSWSGEATGARRGCHAERARARQAQVPHHGVGPRHAGLPAAAGRAQAGGASRARVRVAWRCLLHAHALRRRVARCGAAI